MARSGPRPKVKASQPTPDAAPSETSVLLHPRQLAFFNCGKCQKAFTGGRAAGKSTVGAADILIHAPAKSVCMVISPTYRMLSDSTQRSFIEMATRMGLWDDNQFHKTANVAFLTDGREVLFRSGDEPGKLRGSTVSYIWADECSQMSEDVYNVAIGCLRWGGKQGIFTGTFTPAGKDHWTYRVFADKTNPNVELFVCSTRDNPFVEEAFYNNLLLSYGKGEGGQLRARQELEGEFVVVSGAEWDPSHFSAADLWFDEWPNDLQALRIAALDSSKGIGGRTGDYSAFVKIMLSGGLIWVEADLDNQRNSSAMAATAIEIQKSFQPDWFGIEAEFGGNVLVDDLMNRAQSMNVAVNLALVPTQGVPKEVRIRRLTRFITSRFFRFRRTPGTKLLVQQAESFPFGSHEDGIDALEMAVRIAIDAGCFGEVIE